MKKSSFAGKGLVGGVVTAGRFIFKAESILTVSWVRLTDVEVSKKASYFSSLVATRRSRCGIKKVRINGL